MNVLFIYLDHPYTTEGEGNEQNFDNSVYADIIDADLGFPRTVDGKTFLEVHADIASEVETLTHKGIYMMTGSAYHENLCVTDDEILTTTVELTDGTLVDAAEYDVVFVSHLWNYEYYITYLIEELPETPIIGVQDGGLQDVQSYSPYLQSLNRDVLEGVDGYVSINEQYDQFVDPFVDLNRKITLPVPKGHFSGENSEKSISGRVCVGVGTWNIDYANFYSNLLTLKGAREAGHKLSGEIVGVQKHHQPMVIDYGEQFDDVTIRGFISDGFYDYLSSCELVINLTTRATAGRVSAECAGLGVPCIGNIQNDLQQHCWPKLSVDPFDLNTAIELTKRVCSDQEFRSRVVRQASESIKVLQDHKSAKQQLNGLIEDITSI